MEQKQKTKKTYLKVLKIIGNCLFYGIFGSLAIFSICNGIDKFTKYSFPFFGFRSSVVVSPSMSYANSENEYLTKEMKQINVYDVVTTQNYKNYESIKLYDVITYYSNDTLVCHRVIEKYEDENGKYLVTRGDANNIDDAPINYSLVRGKVVNVTPKVGKALMFMQSPYFYIALFGSLFFIVLGMFIYDYESDKRKRKKIMVENNEQISDNSESEMKKEIKHEE